MDIKIRNLSLDKSGNRILNNIDAEFDPGGINVLIGPNGAGKTSLLRLLGLLDKPTSGEILYDGRSSSALSGSDRVGIRRRMCFVFQSPLVFNGTVYHNLIYGLKVRGLRIEKSKIDAMLSKVGLLHKVKSDARKLSGGETQRLQLARALLLDTEVLIFDEPTANLDPVSTRIIENIFAEIYRSGRTVILSTHNLIQARRFGRKIFYMEKGRIVQEGAAAEVFGRPVSLNVAEFSLSENVIYGSIIRDGENIFLSSNGIKISVVSPLDGAAAGVIRPEDILVSKEPLSSSARNCFRGTIKAIEDIGPVYSVVVDCGGVCFTSLITKQSVMSMGLVPGADVYITFKSTSVHVLPME